MCNEKRKELNLKAGRLIRNAGVIFPVGEEIYNVLRERHGYVGFAHYYLQKSWDESELINTANKTVYKQLLEIDTKLGTTQTEQLFWCVFNALRTDLIKV